MKIIDFNDKYKDDVVDFILNIQNIEFNVNIKLEEQPEINDVHKNFISLGGGFWLAIDEHDRLIGTIGLHRLSPEVAILKKFFIKKESRGHKVGLQLYKKLISFAESEGVLQIYLDTPATARGARNFYIKAGFKEISKENLPIQYSYPDRDSIIFRLNLSPYPKEIITY